ncbi:unnamed protein product [Hapterophycus canaliculatus]
MIAKDSKASRSVVEIVEGCQEVRDLCRAAGLEPKNVKNAVKSGFESLVGGVAWRRHHGEERRNEMVREGPATQTLRAHGFAIGPYDKRVAYRRTTPEIRGETMETAMNAIKSAYYPHGMNVAMWDAALDMETAEFEWLVESGTAKTVKGLVHRYAVFWGQGYLKWEGGLPTGVPDVGCAGNVIMGPDTVYFGNALYVH